MPRPAVTIVLLLLALAMAPLRPARAQRYGFLFEPLPPNLPELETDRETFTPATSTVGKDLSVVEWSYSYIQNRGETANTNSYPELLVRWGLSERIELRIGWNYEIGGGGNVVSALESSEGIGGPFVSSESHVMYGVKGQMTYQHGWIPRSCVILEGFTPTSGEQPATQPVATYAFGWQLENKWRLDFAMRYAQGVELLDTFNKWSPSTVLRIPLNEDFQVHLGYFGNFTEGRAVERSRSFISPGAHYNITPNLELGLRLGWGLTPDAANFFLNTGFGWRF